MNSETPPASPEEAPQFAERQLVEELRQAVFSLRTMLHISALCGIVLSATIFVVFFKEVSTLRRQNDDMAAYINEYNKSFVPLAESVRTNLVDYARFHPTLAPILQKYYATNSAPARSVP